jgi:hypothetical protein
VAGDPLSNQERRRLVGRISLGAAIAVAAVSFFVLVLALKVWIAGLGACFCGAATALLVRVALGAKYLDDDLVGSYPEGAAEAETFREIGNVTDLSEQLAYLFWDRERWVNRRVEQIEFTDQTLVRRRISIDFAIPESLGEEADERWLPLSVLRDWPPVLGLDLRTDDGKPIPLVSKVATNDLDRGVLGNLAAAALGEEAVGGEHLARALDRIVYGKPGQKKRAFEVLRPSVQEIIQAREEELTDDDENDVERFLDMAALLLDSTLLWVKVRGAPGDRVIVKLAYDEPVRRNLFLPRSILSSLGLRSLAVDFEVSHVGDSGSYHLEVTVPAGVEVVGARLTLATDEKAKSRWDRLKESWTVLLPRLEQWLRDRTTGHSHVDRVRVSNVQVLTRKVHIYVHRDRRRSLAAARLLLLPARTGVPFRCAAVALLAAVTSVTYAVVADDVLKAKDLPIGPTVGILTVIPGFLSYAVLTPGEHPFATRLRTLMRGAGVLSAMVPLAHATGLVLAQAGDPWLFDHRDELARVSCVLLTYCAIALSLPPRRRGRRRD